MTTAVLEAWREVGRSIELAQCLTHIARRLSRRLPVDLLVLRRIDVQGRRVETVAVGNPGAGKEPEHARNELSPGEFNDLVAWCREGRVLRGALPGSGAPLLLAAPRGVEGAVLAGPLLGDDGPAGVALFHRRGPSYTEEHARLVQGLLEPLSMALANHSRFHELERLKEAVEADRRALLSRLDRQDIADSVVGSETGLRKVLERVEQVAPTDAPVLLLGETGTGKEVVARTIHSRSRRAVGPMVRVNCGAIPPDLVDSELFGHERGSFTGAVAARKGWFERADGGTLFLDEIGELPPAAQVRLLRILQDGTLERVGAQQPLHVDVRVVAATNADLHAMVAQRSFRQDLWYRIGVFPIRLPPLRERPEDIPSLAAHFAWRAGKRLGFSPLVPSPEDLELLTSYPWPGNVRELAAVIERAAILGDGRRLEMAAALGAPTRQPAAAAAAGAARATTPDEEDRLPTLDEAMAAHVERALARTLGRIEGPFGAAALLGINPHTLRARMRKLGVDRRRFRPPEGRPSASDPTAR